MAGKEKHKVEDEKYISSVANYMIPLSFIL